MRTPPAIGLALCTATLVACSAKSSLTDAPQTTKKTLSPSGTLTGSVTMIGGPYDPRTGKPVLAGSPAAGWPVTVRSRSHVSAKVFADASGRFTFRLPPGAYTLTCGVTSKPVQIEAAAETSADCDIPVA